MRVRAKPNNVLKTVYTNSASPPVTLAETHTYCHGYIVEDEAANGHNVWHSKSEVGSGCYAARTDGSARHTYTAMSYNAQEIPASVDYVLSLYDYSFRLDWSKLPSSTRFSIINFFAELDDTLAMFGAKLYRKMLQADSLRRASPYGFFQWGILPFVNDVKTLGEDLARLIDLFGSDGSFPYEDSDKFQIDHGRLKPAGQPGLAIVGELNVRHTGTGTINPGLGLVLDSLGFHPDIETLWDLAPLSFMVDYFLPIGDTLDSIWNRGWTHSIPFTGWSSYKFVGKMSRTWDKPECTMFPIVPIQYYTRIYRATTLSIPMPEARIVTDFPTLSPMKYINTLYLIAQILMSRSS